MSLFKPFWCFKTLTKIHLKSIDLTILVSILVHIITSLSLSRFLTYAGGGSHHRWEWLHTRVYALHLQSRQRPWEHPYWYILTAGWVCVSPFVSLLWPSHFLSPCPCFPPGSPALEAGAVAACSAGASVSSTQSCNYEIIHYGSTFWVVNGL